MPRFNTYNCFIEEILIGQNSCTKPIPLIVCIQYVKHLFAINQILNGCHGNINVFTCLLLLVIISNVVVFSDPMHQPRINLYYK